MSIRPLLFYAPMIHALLEDRKTQTRRLVSADATAEGISDLPATMLIGSNQELAKWFGPSRPDATAAIAKFASIWQKINGYESWAENPWVWALTFKVHHANIDALPQAGKAA